MEYKRVLTVQDISCVGQCSLTVALPIISACGHETAVLPSAVLSTHTAGFKNFTVNDMTEDMPGILAHWMSEGIRFDAIYTGYLGSTAQIGIVGDIISKTRAESCPVIIDPAMADNGRLYPAFDEKYVEAMRGLCERADYLLPNITEAAFLCGMEYKESYDMDYIEALIGGLKLKNGQTLVLTGVSTEPDMTGVAVASAGGNGVNTRIYSHKKLARSCHGTGDVYASAFTGALMNGKTAFESASIAADYTVRCIEVTEEKHWWGVQFEKVIKELIDKLA